MCRGSRHGHEVGWARVAAVGDRQCRRLLTALAHGLSVWCPGHHLSCLDSSWVHLREMHVPIGWNCAKGAR